MRDLPTFGERVPGQAYQPRPGVYAIVADDRGRVAVVRTAQGCGLPGGGIEPGETHDEALARELREECGAEIGSAQPLFEAVQYLFAKGEGYFVKHSTFYRVWFDGSARGAASAGHELQWLVPAEARLLLDHESHRWALAQAVSPRG